MSGLSFSVRAMLAAIAFASLMICSDSPAAPQSDRFSAADEVSLAKLLWSEPIDLGLLDVVEGGPYQSYANALNDRDEVVGRSSSWVGPGASIGLAYRWTPDGPNTETGRMAVLRTPGGSIPPSSEALDINEPLDFLIAEAVLAERHLEEQHG